MGTDDDIKFEEDGEYSKKDDKLTFRDIVLQQLKKIGTNSNVEFRGGYYDEEPHPSPQIDKVLKKYIPDTREVYSNSVQYLYDILHPYFKVEIKKQLKEIEDEDDANLKKLTGKHKDVHSRMQYRNLRRELSRKTLRIISKWLHDEKYMEVGEIED